jgi:hypothetical protein
MMKIGIFAALINDPQQQIFMTHWRIEDEHWSRYFVD